MTNEPQPLATAIDPALTGYEHLASPLAVCATITPNFRMRPHQKVISDAIVNAFFGNGPKFIAISQPPQTGKSTLVSIATPLWVMEMHTLGLLPGGLCGLVSYEDSLPMTWSKKVRRELTARQNLFATRPRSDSRAATFWENEAEGGIIATGIGGTIIGRSITYLDMDDLIKNFAQASSQIHRDTAWNFWQQVGVGRLQQWTVVVATMTRWHEDDLLGRIKSDEYEGDPNDWLFLNFPAIAEEDDILGREPGDPLFRPQWDQTPEQAKEEMLRVKGSISEYSWNALWQGRPTDPAGAIFYESKWRYYGADSSYVLPDRFDLVVMCLPRGTQIFTERGPRPIEEVRIGDRVWSLDETGKTMRLARVWKSAVTGEDEILRLEMNGRTLRCNSRHRIRVRRKFRAPRGGPGGYKAVEWRNIWLPAGEIVVGDYVFAAHGLPDQLMDEAPNGRLLTEEFMAFAGLLIGDGSVLTGNVSIAHHPNAPYVSIYKKFAEREFRSARGSRKGIPRDTPSPAEDPIRWTRQEMSSRFASASAVRELRELGLAGTAITKRVPEWVFNLRPNLILAFLRGYLDADGAVNARGHITYSSVSRLLLEDIRHLCFLLGIPVSGVSTYRTAGRAQIMGRWVNCRDMNQIYLFDLEANRRIGALHPEKNSRLMSATRAGLGIQRWQKGYKGNGSKGSRPGDGFEVSNVALVQVRRITRESSERVYDLGVEGTHSFIADGVVVHNSWDMAFKDESDSDFVVGQAWGTIGADHYLLDEVRGRWDFTVTKQMVRNFAATIRTRYSNATAVLVEDKANGTAIMNSLRKTVGGFIPITPKESKIARAHSVQPLLLGGNLYLPSDSSAPWIREYVKELSSFPRGTHDDRVDCTTQALNYLVQFGHGGARWRSPANTSLANPQDPVSKNRPSTIRGAGRLDISDPEPDPARSPRVVSAARAATARRGDSHPLRESSRPARLRIVLPGEE